MHVQKTHHWESRCWERQLEFLAMRALILLSCCVGLDTSSKSCEAGNIRHSVPGSLCLSSSPLPLKITHFPIHCLSASALQKQALTSPNSLCFCAILWFVPFLIFFVLEYMTKWWRSEIETWMVIRKSLVSTNSQQFPFTKCSDVRYHMCVWPIAYHLSGFLKLGSTLESPEAFFKLRMSRSYLQRAWFTWAGVYSLNIRTF